MRVLNNDKTISIEKTFTSKEDFESFKTIEDSVKEKTVKTYSSKEIQKKANVKVSQIKHWTMAGVIEPYIAVQGTGKMHIYDHQNLMEAMICRELGKYSININLMKETLDFLRTAVWTFIVSWKIQNKKIKSDVRKKPKIVSSSTMFDNIVKDLSIWDYLKIDESFHNNFCLLLWTDPKLLTELSKPNIDEYFIALACNDLSFYTSRFSSLILINLSVLRDDAGYFFKEDIK